MTGVLEELSTSQLRSAMRSCTDIALSGAQLSFIYAESPVRPYFTERLVYQRLVRNARTADDRLDEHGVYDKVFSARPEGWRMTPDVGGATRFYELFEEAMMAIEAAAPFHVHKRLTGSLRAQGQKTPAPILALERARQMRRKAYSQVEANIGAQRVLAAEGMFPAEPLACFIEIPRLRRDGDWLIGALKRLATALLEATDALLAAEAFLARGYTLFPETKAKEKAARRALPLLAGVPAIHSTRVAQSLQISQKAAIAAMTALQEAGLAREITGQQRYQAWVADDPVLGLPDSSYVPPTLLLPGGGTVKLAS
ncbi:MAG: helix-turn-helix domain-containing protein [Pseudomonadota bacterium]